MKSKEYIKQWMQEEYPEFFLPIICAGDLYTYPMWERLRDDRGYKRISRKLKKRMIHMEWVCLW